MIHHRLVMLMRIEKGRSPLTLNIFEILFAILVGVMTWLYLHASLWSQQPYPWNYPSQDALPPWFVSGRDELFRTYAFPITAIMTLAAISLLRAIRDDVRDFSRLGHVALASPLLSLALVGLLSPITDIAVVLLTIAAVLRTIATRKNKGNLIAPGLVILWLLVDIQFTSHLWNLISD